MKIKTQEIIAEMMEAEMTEDNRVSYPLYPLYLDSIGLEIVRGCLLKEKENRQGDPNQDDNIFLKIVISKVESLCEVARAKEQFEKAISRYVDESVVPF